MGEKMSLKIFVFAVVTALPKLQNDQASAFLSRERRASNRKHFEEIRPGNLERECLEEDCSKTELYEVFDDMGHPGLIRYAQCLQHTQEEIEANRMPETDKKKWLRHCINSETFGLYLRKYESQFYFYTSVPNYPYNDYYND